MSKLLAAAVVAALFLTAAPAAGERPSRRERQCRYQWVDKATWTDREERLTAECVTAKWSVPGGLAEFDKIIDCESGWYRVAVSSSGSYVGLAQHARSAWASRVQEYAPPHWRLKTRWENSRTMLTITARMMHDVGLSPWTCA